MFKKILCTFVICSALSSPALAQRLGSGAEKDQQQLVDMVQDLNKMLLQTNKAYRDLPKKPVAGRKINKLLIGLGAIPQHMTWDDENIILYPGMVDITSSGRWYTVTITGLGKDMCKTLRTRLLGTNGLPEHPINDVQAICSRKNTEVVIETSK